MIVKELTLYTVEELRPDVKAKVLNKYRHANTDGLDWWDYTFEYCVEILGRLGIEIGDRRGHGGKAIFFSGFCNQGDGASFDACVEPKRDMLSSILQYAVDRDIHLYAARLHCLQQRHRFMLTGEVEQSGWYNHENTMELKYVECEHCCALDRHPSADDADELLCILRGLARWVYGSLEQEYEYLTEDEQVIDFLEGHEWLFTANGDEFKDL